jgi:hypothetical protein
MFHQLEELLRSTPPTYEYMDDPLNRALTEISSLANNMNEGKRESESRRKLVQWQARIRGKFPSPLVQPHRYVTFISYVAPPNVLQAVNHGRPTSLDTRRTKSYGVF